MSHRKLVFELLGQIMCGNPVRALRRRNKDNTRGHVSFRHDKPQRIFQPEHSYLEEDKNTGEKDDILQELKEWRMKNRRYHKHDHHSLLLLSIAGIGVSKNAELIFEIGICFMREKYLILITDNEKVFLHNITPRIKFNLT